MPDDGYYNRGGGASGDQSGGGQGGGGAGGTGEGGQAGGGGEAGTVLYRYEIYDSGGFKSQSGFDYSTLEDARDAGLAQAVYPERVWVVANKVGFTGPNSWYDTQPPLEEGVVVTEGPGPGWEWSPRYGKYIKISDYVWDSVLNDWVPPGTATPPPDPDDHGSPGLPGLPVPDSNWMMYLIIGIIIIAIIAFGLKGGS